MGIRRAWRRALLGAGVIVALAAAPAGAAPPTLDWTACAEGVECTAAAVPRDHADRGGPTLDLAVARVPARDPTQRIGSVFLNFGGPGAPGAQILRSVGPEGFAALGDRGELGSPRHRDQRGRGGLRGRPGDRGRVLPAVPAPVRSGVGGRLR